MFKIYVAAPYADAAFVRDAIHPKLSTLDMLPVSRWAAQATGPEDFSRLSTEALQRAADQNDHDLMSSDAVLVVARDGAGGEMFAEARVAIEWGKPVVWVGRRTLSAFRRDVVRAEDLDDGIRILVAMQELHERGARGHLMSSLARSA